MLVPLFTQIYHTVVPLAIRRRLRLTRLSPSRRARALLWRRTGGCIAAGPFAGVRLDGDVPDDCQADELLGSYECEAHPWIERQIARGWPTIVNIGSGHGLYSTGLAMRMRGATVYAYELLPEQRVATERSARRNGVADRVHVLGAADPAGLAACPVDPEVGAFVVCDCEGYERDLLDPVRVPWLATSAMLVELHDFAAPGATAALRTRFGASHEVEEVEQQPRDAADWAAKAGISPTDAAILSVERRTWGNAEMLGRWMLLTPRGVDHR